MTSDPDLAVAEPPPIVRRYMAGLWEGHARGMVPECPYHYQNSMRRWFAPCQPCRPGYVYVMRFSDRVKIGLTRQLGTRILRLTQVHGPCFGVTAIRHSCGERAEAELHIRWEHARIGGEWYTLEVAT